MAVPDDMQLRFDRRRYLRIVTTPVGTERANHPAAVITALAEVFEGKIDLDAWAAKWGWKAQWMLEAAQHTIGRWKQIGCDHTFHAPPDARNLSLEPDYPPRWFTITVRWDRQLGETWADFLKRVNLKLDHYKKQCMHIDRRPGISDERLAELARYQACQITHTDEIYKRIGRTAKALGVALRDRGRNYTTHR
jgi:hypothetical protein